MITSKNKRKQYIKNIYAHNVFEEFATASAVAVWAVSNQKRYEMKQTMQCNYVHCVIANDVKVEIILIITQFDL